jgi:two-component system, OmpR family, phosphate regulon sensor histidine kinase PhoR
MEAVLVIAVAGLALALAASLIALRNRAAELDSLVARTATRAAPPTGAGAGRDSGTGSVSPAVDPLDGLLPVGILHLDDVRRVDRANARAHALLEVAAGRLVGRTVMEAFLDARVEALVGGVPDGGSATGEIRIGAAEPHAVMLRVHRLADGGAWIVLEDVTELRRLQQIRTEFIDNLGHELRTPLSTVSLLAETLARDAETADVPPRMRERIAKVEVETGHLVQMVNELLDLARIEGGTELHLADDIDIGRLAVASAERLRLFADRQGVDLVVRADPDAPPVRGDEERLGQVFVNLVHNAVKFSPGGGQVVIEVRADGADVVTSVTDHGIGISRTDADRIFERFYKADRARVRGGGTGLGLAIARHVVEGHGGRIWVESEEGRGSTFAFSIPARPRAGGMPDAPEPELAAPEPA